MMLMVVSPRPCVGHQASGGERPDYAEPLAGVAAQAAVVTKSHRFDIYPSSVTPPR